MEANKKFFGFGRIQIATSIAILFHAIGLIGILWVDRSLFASLTGLNLMLMFSLILFTQEKFETGFLLLVLICFSVGMITEYIGVNTGMLFGDYRYGKVLGPSFKGVPWIIGLNWFMVIYSCGTFMQVLLMKIKSDTSAWFKTLSLLIDGATMAAAFDWLMEPVAVDLGFWKWGGAGEIPLFNYACWFLVSLLLLTGFRFLKFNKHNLFAIHLLLIQGMFFLLLRTLL